MTMLERLDRIVHTARLDILTPHAQRRPRNLRWWPLLVIAALVVGYALMAASMHGRLSLRAGVAGGFLFFVAYAVSLLIRLFGPRLVPEGATGLDEREQMIKARAGSLSGTILCVAAIQFCFWAAYASLFGGWMPKATLEWVYLGLGLQGAAFTLPVLIASWLQPALNDDE